MAGRPKIFNEQLAVRKAANLFWQKGYEATSTEDLIQVMGLQRGSFYHSFGSKKELYIHAINFQETNSFDELKKLMQESQSLVKAIKSVFLSLAECSVEEHQKGCFAGNTLVELSGIDEELVENARKHLQTLEEIFFQRIKAAQQTGELKTKEDPRLLAMYLLNLWNGLNITRRVYPSKQSLRRLIEWQLEILH